MGVKRKDWPKNWGSVLIFLLETRRIRRGGFFKSLRLLIRIFPFFSSSSLSKRKPNGFSRKNLELTWAAKDTPRPKTKWWVGSGALTCARCSLHGKKSEKKETDPTTYNNTGPPSKATPPLVVDLIASFSPWKTVGEYKHFHLTWQLIPVKDFFFLREMFLAIRPFCVGSEFANSATWDR